MLGPPYTSQAEMSMVGELPSVVDNCVAEASGGLGMNSCLYKIRACRTGDLATLDAQIDRWGECIPFSSPRHNRFGA